MIAAKVFFFRNYILPLSVLHFLHVRLIDHRSDVALSASLRHVMIHNIQ